MTREEIQALSDYGLDCALAEYDLDYARAHYEPISIEALRMIETKLTLEQCDKYVRGLYDGYTLPEDFSAPVWDEFTLRTGILIGLKHALAIPVRRRAEALLWVLKGVKV
jgi:hypothetical protein